MLHLLSSFSRKSIWLPFHYLAIRVFLSQTQLMSFLTQHIDLNCGNVSKEDRSLWFLCPLAHGTLASLLDHWARNQIVWFHLFLPLSSVISPLACNLPLILHLIDLAPHSRCNFPQLRTHPIHIIIVFSFFSSVFSAHCCFMIGFLEPSNLLHRTPNFSPSLIFFFPFCAFYPFFCSPCNSRSYLNRRC